MKSQLGRIWIVLLMSLTVSGLVAQSLPLPRSVCKLTAKDYTVRLESNPVQRVLFSGCMEMQGDPARLFFLDRKPAPDCAIQYYYDWAPDIKLQIRVYRDAGETRFDDIGWNARMVEALEKLKDTQWEVEKPFDGEARNGTPVLGYVSLDCLIRLKDPETEAVTRHRYCMVPVPEKDLVLLVGFFAPEKHFDSINREFDRFVRGLHRRP